MRNIPYWVSPPRRGHDPKTRQVVFLVDIAPSRAERKKRGVTVSIPMVDVLAVEIEALDIKRDSRAPARAVSELLSQRVIDAAIANGFVSVAA